MLHPAGRKGIVIGPHGVKYRLKGSGWNKRRGRYVQRRPGVMHMSNAAARAGARR